MAVSYETIAKALFVHYESLYDVELETGAYYCFYESESYEKHGIEKHGEDFFSELRKTVHRVVVPEDRDYVLAMLTKEALQKGTQRGECYSFVYRVYQDGEPVYHKIRAMQEKEGESTHVYIGVRDIDYLIRRERAHYEEVRSLQQKKEKEMEELERKLQLCRIRNFTGQMQPHFLYNALGSIQEIMLEDTAYAFELLGDFTTYLRGCIRSMADDRLVAFSQEMENIRAYVNIEKMRFGEKLDVVFDIQSADFQVLPLSIQPIVENAIRHGIYQRGKDGGRVIIRTREDDTHWIVEVEDNGVGFDVVKRRAEIDQGKSESMGLRNLTFRLKSVMNAEVDLKSTVGEGTTVTVTIPKPEGGKRDEDDYCR